MEWALLKEKLSQILLDYFSFRDMQKKTAASVADAFYFQLIPKYFKVEHGFAKTIKPNTTYRLTIFKGIQKADEMSEPIKGKLVGGKIIFDKTVLNFYLPLYSPARNIQFTVKVLETKPAEEEVEIASHKIKSGDFIKQFKSDSVSYFKQEVALIESLSLVFDLFVHSSKIQLQKIVNQNLQKSKVEGRSNLTADKRGSKTPRRNQATSEILSQSDASQSNSLNRNSGVFASKKKLVRKRGHDGKLRSKHGSRQGSEVGSSRSRSSRKSFGPFPHNEQNQHFVRSPKKVSPPKVQESSKIASEVKPTKRQNLVTIGRRQSQYSDAKNESGVRNTTPTKLGKVESNRERSQSAKKPRINGLGITTPTTDRKGNPVSKSELHELQIQTKQNLFEIKRKTQTKVNEAEKKQKTEAPPLPSRVTVTKSTAKPVQQSKVAPQPQIVVEHEPISKPTESPLKKQQSIKNEQKGRSSRVEEPGPNEEKLSQKSKQREISHISVKQKPVVQQGQHEKAEKKMRASIRLPSSPTIEPDAEETAGRQYEGLKDKVFYLFFVVLSAFLFWNAVTPSRKV